MKKLVAIVGLILAAACSSAAERDNTAGEHMQGDTVLGHDQHASDAPISGTNLPAAREMGPQSSVVVQDTAMVAPDTTRPAARP